MTLPLMCVWGSDSIRGSVIEVVEYNLDTSYQKLKIKLDTGDEVEVENNPQETGRDLIYKKGENLILQRLEIGDSERYIITDYYRTNSLIFLFIVFALLAIIVGKKYGFFSIVAMVISFLVIFKFILPQISSGKSPMLITILASFFIVPTTFYLSHGFNRKTHVAVVSTFITLIVTSIITSISVNVAHLTGYSSDEAMFLQIGNENINMRGILLAGIIIGFLGVLDDVTVSQSSIVEQLKKTNRDMGTLELYSSAMKVGRDHISSMINTLVLVYAGASLPLLLLFINNPQPINQVLSIELVADEVVRTLVGSIGLTVAVPLTTLIATMVFDD
jgi:uncharacterized membrane protein